MRVDVYVVRDVVDKHLVAHLPDFRERFDFMAERLGVEVVRVDFVGHMPQRRNTLKLEKRSQLLFGQLGLVIVDIKSYSYQ